MDPLLQRQIWLEHAYVKRYMYIFGRWSLNHVLTSTVVKVNYVEKNKYGQVIPSYPSL